MTPFTAVWVLANISSNWFSLAIDPSADTPVLQSYPSDFCGSVIRYTYVTQRINRNPRKSADVKSLSLARGPQLKGKDTVTDRPCVLGSVSSTIVAPWASAMVFTIAMPSPLPGGEVPGVR